MNRSSEQHQKYLKQYIDDTDGLLLSIQDIQAIRKRKNMPLAETDLAKGLLLTEILFSDLNRKQAVFTDYPWHTANEFIPFENLNRKFSCFIDLQ